MGYGEFKILFDRRLPMQFFYQSQSCSAIMAKMESTEAILLNKADTVYLGMLISRNFCEKTVKSMKRDHRSYVRKN